MSASSEKTKYNSNPKCHACESTETILDNLYWTCWRHIKREPQKRKKAVDSEG